MSKLLAKLLLLSLYALPCLSSGCSPDGGAVGDSNDPATSGTDEEMMDDETDEMIDEEGEQ